MTKNCLLLTLSFLYLLLGVATIVVKVPQNVYYQNYKNPYGSFASVQGNLTDGRRMYIGSDSYVITEEKRLKITGSGEKYNNVIIKNETRKTENNKENNNVAIETLPSEILQLNENIVIIKIAARFRNNLIKAFGYILHRNKMELNSALYTSLYFILGTIKLNQVNIISMVPILKELSFKTSNERFLKIFEAMEKHLPEYLRCAATFWKETIAKKEININNILQPNANGPLIVDILEGLNDELFEKVEKDIKLNEELDAKEKKVFYNFNLNIVQIMRYIKKHNKEIHRLFISALVIFFPRSLIQPDLEESIQVFVEYLEQNEISEWTKYVDHIDVSKVEDPYNVVEDILNNLILDESISVVVKDSLQIIINNLANRNPTAINPNYNSMANFVTLTNISISYMLQYIQKGAYPIEIVIAGHRLIYYLEHGYMRYLSLLDNFNPYFYLSASEVLAAILIRVVKRQPDLPLEVSDSAGAVYSYLIFTIRYIQFPSVMPNDLQNVEVLLFGLRPPDIEYRLVQKLVVLISLMQTEQVAYEQVLKDIPVYKCSTPLTCFFELLEFLMKNNLPSDETKQTLWVIFKSSCYIVQCPIQEWINNKNVTFLFPPYLIPPIINDFRPGLYHEEQDSASTTNSSTASTTLTTTKSTAPPSEGPISSPTTLRSTAATTPTGITTKKEVDFDPTETVPADSTVIMEFVYSAVHNETRLVQQILKLLQSEEFKTTISKDQHLTIITLLTVLFKGAEEQIEDHHIRKILEKYKAKITHVQEILQLITTEKQPTEPILVRLIVAVPAPTNAKEEKLFNQLTLLLQRQELFELVVNKVTNENYKNVASLLKAVLVEEVKLKEKLTHDEREAASYYVDKIQTLGLGQGKIEWGAKVDVITQEINFSQIMDNGIGYHSLDNEKRKQFNSIILYLRENPAILQTWDKWVYYTKSGDFTKALFNLLLNQASLPPEIRTAVSSLTPLINFDKTGAKPSLGRDK